MRTVTALLGEEAADDPETVPEIGLGPDVASMGLAASLEDTTNAPKTAHEDDVRIDLDMDLEGIDDDEIDTYIMNEKEFEYKNVLWHRKNADYLEEQKVKAERLQKERDEGKPEKKRKRTTKRKAIGPANSAGEAIEKIVQEKKISTKINYDVLKSLSAAPTPCETVDVEAEDAATTSESIKRRRLSSVSNYLEASETSNRRKTKGKFQMGLPVFEDTPKEDLQEVITKEGKMKKEEETKKEPTIIVSEDEMDEDYEDDEQPAETNNEMGVLQMLRQHREDEEDPQEFGYGYYEEPDY
ncbi:unnamed protein product [Phaedon cochleariae]|uniref:Brf1 TBP-binding domain-containing protein n=1 Tax=Phaedon cochleariae TaxID=80249 RepID=A0A9N9X0Y5_PHACE|nr:unnamed protein product [Phaedon cochleariae]